MREQVQAAVDQLHKFNVGYDWRLLDEAIGKLEAAIRPQWVNADDGLPCEVITVLMITADRTARLFGYWSGTQWVSYGLGIIDGVTHWHPVEIDYPEPPEVKP